MPLVVAQPPRPDLLTISKLPGDAVTRVIRRHYAHLCHNTLNAAVAKLSSLGHQAETKRKPDARSARTSADVPCKGMGAERERAGGSGIRRRIGNPTGPGNHPFLLFMIR